MVTRMPEDGDVMDGIIEVFGSKLLKIQWLASWESSPCHATSTSCRHSPIPCGPYELRIEIAG